jgi:hypothetical protein
MTSHEDTTKTDDTDRDLKGEATEIKLAVTKKPFLSKTSDEKDFKPRVSIGFTSLAQSAIPGFTSQKILGHRLLVTYVPDTFYVLELAQRIFAHAKHDKDLKRIDNINVHSFTLYMAHALLYVIFRTVQDSNPPSVDLSTILEIYDKAGFASAKVPAICSHWIDGIGKFQDPPSKRLFQPELPTLATGAILDSGFLSADTGHLLPNIFALLSITRMAATRETGFQILIAATTIGRQGYFGLDSTNVGLTNSIIGRSNAMRIPGAKALGVPCNDQELLQVIDVALTSTFSDPMQNLFKVTPALLLQLSTSMNPLFLHIETVNLSTISPVGNSLCTVPLIASKGQVVVTPEVKIEATTGQNPVGAMSYVAEYDHKSRVQTRFEVINGNNDYAYQTPIVRIVHKDEAIKISDHQFVDPQHRWYSAEIEFQTPFTTLAEARSYVKRLD